MRLSAVLVTVSVLALAPAASAVAPPSPSPSAADPAADPCAPVDGQAPVMCQGGVSELPFTGRDDVPALAATGAALVLAGAGVLVVARRRGGQPA